mmetsp:Transcript_117120/g.175008  ORF Transcript_117120/g.175008 Transcript_117120/m.175008 type:complete len:129 (+) Transcript_117120:1018-1404(+)
MQAVRPSAGLRFQAVVVPRKIAVEAVELRMLAEVVGLVTPLVVLAAEARLAVALLTEVVVRHIPVARVEGGHHMLAAAEAAHLVDLVEEAHHILVARAGEDLPLAYEAPAVLFRPEKAPPADPVELRL